ncbi:MAG: L,D-transpeptidase family protein [Paraprevotella sp.]|nr:L,D-transpeptidase family protein [Paraprevotella sp.]
MNKRTSFFLCIVLLILTACDSNEKQTRNILSLSDMESWQSPAFHLSAKRIRYFIDSLRLREPQLSYIDKYTSRFYADKQSFLWIDRIGTDTRADSLLNYLEQETPTSGLPSRLFAIRHLREQLRLLHALEGSQEQLMARLEYGLTRSYLRMACGQRYGFINPRHVFNQLEKQDTTDKAPYRQLFDLPTESVTDSFISEAIRAARTGTAVSFLQQTIPADPLYHRLKKELATLPDTSDRYRRLCANLERRRWRYPRPSGKYVWVNVAAFELRAVDEQGDSAITMKVCVGNRKHKSPLLCSNIRYVELNPYWVVPYNIIKTEIAPLHAGKSAYFIRNRMKIIEKNTKREMEPEEMTRAMFLSGQYMVRQENGEGNSLGRLIFRFPNNFSVFLHDTDNRRAFLRQNRAISHGCIRVEKPLELAVFLMQRPEELAIDKIRLAIDLPPLSKEGAAWMASEKYKPIGIHRYKPEIPVFLDYYTIYPDTEGTLRDHGDPYGYDTIILEKLGWL